MWGLLPPRPREPQSKVMSSLGGGRCGKGTEPQVWLNTDPQNSFEQIRALPPACFPGIQKPLQAPLVITPGDSVPPAHPRPWYGLDAHECSLGEYSLLLLNCTQDPPGFSSIPTVREPSPPAQLTRRPRGGRGLGPLHPPSLVPPASLGFGRGQKVPSPLGPPRHDQYTWGVLLWKVLGPGGFWGAHRSRMHTVITCSLCPRCRIKVYTAVESAMQPGRPCGHSASRSRVSWGPACEHHCETPGSTWNYQGWEGQWLKSEVCC